MSNPAPEAILKLLSGQVAASERRRRRGLRVRLLLYGIGVLAIVGLLVVNVLVWTASGVGS